LVNQPKLPIFFGIYMVLVYYWSVNKFNNYNMSESDSLKWNENPKIIIVLLIVFFPLGLYFMWKNSIWSKKTRWIVTGIISVMVIGNGLNRGELSGKNFFYEKSGYSNEYGSFVRTKGLLSFEDDKNCSLFITINDESSLLSEGTYKIETEEDWRGWEFQKILFTWDSGDIGPEEGDLEKLYVGEDNEKWKIRLNGKLDTEYYWDKNVD